MRATLLLVGLLAAGALQATEARAPFGAANDDPSCLDLADHDSCLDAGCAWCASDLLGDKCVAAAVGKLVPTTLATCDLPPEPSAAANNDGGADKPKPPAAVSCGDNKSKRDCLDLGAQEGDCAWCEGDYMPASCVGLKAAEWIPGTVATCKLPMKHEEGGDNELGKGKGKKDKKKKKKHDDDDDDDKDLPATCGDVKCRKACVKHGSQEGACSWCSGGYMPAGCMAEMAAKYIPESVAGKCEAPRKPKHVAAPQRGGDDDDDLPATCADVDDRKDCIKHGSQEGACAWCSGGYMLAGCVDEVKARFLPEKVAGKCDAGKKNAVQQLPQPEAAVAAAASRVEGLVERVFGALMGGSGGKEEGGSGGDGPSPWGPPGGGGGGGCMDYKSKKKCLKGKGQGGGCAWCDQKYMGESCLDEMTAKYLPSMVAECKFPKSHKKLSAKVQEQDDDGDDDEQEEQEEQRALRLPVS